MQPIIDLQQIELEGRLIGAVESGDQQAIAAAKERLAEYHRACTRSSAAPVPTTD